MQQWDGAINHSSRCYTQSFISNGLVCLEGVSDWVYKWVDLTVNLSNANTHKHTHTDPQHSSKCLNSFHIRMTNVWWGERSRRSCPPPPPPFLSGHVVLLLRLRYRCSFSLYVFICAFSLQESWKPADNSVEQGERRTSPTRSKHVRLSRRRGLLLRCDP